MTTAGLARPKVSGTGDITYLCHTCGEPIAPDDLLVVDEVYPLTTHHAHHLEEEEQWPPTQD